MVSPVGVGFLILKKELLGKLKPLTIGSSTYGTCDDPSTMTCIPKHSALRFESGSKQVLEITALGASAKMIKDVGVEVIQKESERLAQMLHQGLLERGYFVHSPQVSAISFVNISGRSLPETTSKLKNAKISFALRGPGVRLSPHALNSDEDIARTLEALS